MESKLEKFKLFFFGQPKPQPQVIANRPILVNGIHSARAFVKQHGLIRFIETRYKSIDLIHTTSDLVRLFLKVPAEFHRAIISLPSIRAILESTDIITDLYEVLRATPAAYCEIMRFDSVNNKLYQERFLQTFVLDHFKASIIFKNPLNQYVAAAFCFAEMLQYNLRCNDIIETPFEDREDNIFYYYQIAAKYDFLPAKEALPPLLLRQANKAINAFNIDQALGYLLQIPHDAKEYGDAQFIIGELFFTQLNLKQAIGHLLPAHRLGIDQATRLLNQALNSYYDYDYRGTLDSESSEKLINQFTAENSAAQIEELDLQFEPAVQLMA
ncbi:MAG: hypothetical protein M3R00_03015 [Pseudomonadota bacterium]|nr:hypothetical protein [Pseudomonadota bacterium]